MEVLSGNIVDFRPDGLMIWLPYQNIERACLREYKEVQVGLPDGRTLSPEQRRKAYALMGEIAEWSGNTPEEVKLTTKRDFVEQHLQGLQKALFSLSNCDVTTAREFITYLIEFILTFDVPTHVPLGTLCDDIQRYVYACLIHKKCAVCGRKADLHHVDRVGMGRDRTDICHIGMEALPLCREHHEEAHQHGDAALMEKYHLEAVAIDEKIAKANKLKERNANEQTDDHRESDA